MDKPESSYNQVRNFARKDEHGKNQQKFLVNYEPKEIFYLLDVLNSAYVEATTNKPICDVQQKVMATI